MSDEQTLFLVLVLLYLSDCVVWARQGAVALTDKIGTGRFGIAALEILSNHHGRAMALNPLSPLSTAFLCQAWPISLSPEGICSYAVRGIDDAGPLGNACRAIRWEDAVSVRTESNDVLIGGERLVRCSSREPAVSLAARIAEIAGMGEDERSEAIRHGLAETLDAGRIAERIEETRRETSVLRPLCVALFLLMFIGSPWVVSQHGFLRAIIALLSLGLPIHVAILAFSWRAHRRLCPVSREERWQHLIMMLLCPPMAARVVDIVSRHALGLFHPIATAHALCAPDAFREFAKRMLLRLRYPLGSEQLAPEALAIETWFREETMHAIETFLREQEIDPIALCELRLPDDAAYRAYCPRCHSGFLRDEGECPDCPGVRLAQIETTGGTAS